VLISLVISVQADNSRLRSGKCSFPFTYKGNNYNYCTKVNSNKYWCSEKSDYDGKWHYCEETKDDKFDRIFKTLDEYVREIESLRAKLGKLGQKSCGCQAELDLLEKGLKQTDLIVKDHERRLKDTDRNTELITIINTKITKIEVIIPQMIKVIHIVEKGGGKVVPPKPKVVIPSGTHCRFFYGRGFLFVPNRHLNWLQALKYCQDHGMTLAKIHNQNENTMVARTAMALKRAKWWFGANDRNHEGQWRWADNSGVGFTAWNRGEPNNYRNEDCAHFGWWGNSPGLWNDWYCHMPSPFICESNRRTCVK
jgi:hypothetical protein